MSKITEKLVKSLEPSERDVFAWDSELRGFGVRVKPSGAKSYLIQYRNEHGRSRRKTLGSCARLRSEQARELAKADLGAVDAGNDPVDQRLATRNAPTVKKFADRYVKAHVLTRMKPRSAAEEQRMLAKFILPAMGGHKVTDVRRADVVRLHHSLSNVPIQANRVFECVRRMMNVAEKWGVRTDGTNPCHRVERFKERSRERYLSARELAALGDTLTLAERTRTELPGVVAAIRLLILTGCRLSEILTLRWEHVDFEKGCLRLADSKTGAKVVHLNAPALSLLEGMEREDGSPWVIAGGKPGSHLVNLQKPWRRIRTKAGLDDVRLHDLRHSFASVAVGLGEGLPMIGKLLGHTQTQTTARYAPLAADPVKAATERVGAALAGMMKGTAGEVTELPHRRR